MVPEGARKSLTRRRRKEVDDMQTPWIIAFVWLWLEVWIPMQCRPPVTGERIEVYSIDFSIRSEMAISPQSIMRRMSAYHVSVHDTVIINGVVSTIDSIQRSNIGIPGGTDARIACLLFHQAGPPDTIGLGRNGTEINSHWYPHSSHLMRLIYPVLSLQHQALIVQEMGWDQ